MPKKPKAEQEEKLDIRERNLGKHQAYGLFWTATKKIEIDPRLRNKDYLYVLTHELTHMALPEATEEAVVRISELISRGIWQQGYRRLKE